MLSKKDSGCRDKVNAINMKIILTCFSSQKLKRCKSWLHYVFHQIISEDTSQLFFNFIFDIYKNKITGTDNA